MNIRKIAALVLAAVMLLLPTLSLCEESSSSFLDRAYAAGRNVKTTISVTPGDLFSVDPDLSMVAAILKVLRIETSVQQKGDDSLSQLDLFLQGSPALSITLLENSNEMHLLSSLIGDTVLSFSLEEIADLYINIMEAYGDSGMSTAELEAFRASIISSDGIVQTEATFADYLGFDEESLKKDLETPLNAWFSSILEQGEVTPGTFKNDMHDTAVTKRVSGISPASLGKAITILTNWALIDQNLEVLTELASSSAIQSGEAAYSKEEMRTTLSQLPIEYAKVKDDIFEKPIKITELMDASGVRKAFEVEAYPMISAGTTSLIAGQYIKTQNDAETTSYQLKVNSSDEDLCLIFSKTQIPEEVTGSSRVGSNQWNLYGSYGSQGVNMGSITLAFTSKTTESKEKIQDDWTIHADFSASGAAFGGSLTGAETTNINDLDAKAEGAINLYMLGVSKPALAIAYTKESSAANPLPVIPEDSVRLGKMSMEELKIRSQEIYPLVMSSIMGIMSKLPPDVLMKIYNPEGI